MICAPGDCFNIYGLEEFSLGYADRSSSSGGGGEGEGQTEGGGRWMTEEEEAEQKLRSRFDLMKLFTSNSFVDDS